MSRRLLKRVEKLEEKAHPHKTIYLISMWTTELGLGGSLDPQFRNAEEREAFIRDWREQKPDNCSAIVNSAIVENWRKTGTVQFEKLI